MSRSRRTACAEPLTVDAESVLACLAVGLREPCSHDMGTHMKTTVEISDSLLDEAKAVAAKRGTTLRELIETSLRAHLKSLRRRSERFRLRDASFGGSGLQPEFRADRWDEIREAAYEGRGG